MSSSDDLLTSIILVAPQPLPPTFVRGSSPSIFLAGGISNCPDWQSPMLKYLLERFPKGLVVFNPRRSNFDVSDPNVTEEQIRWEHSRLAEASVVMFWFPKETLCPITLLELGKMMMVTGKRLFVGCDEEYRRRVDVVFQLSLERPDDVSVASSLDEVRAQIVRHFRELLPCVAEGDL